MIKPDDMVTIQQMTHLRTYIANRIKISEHVLRNMSISEIQEAHFDKVYEVIQAFYRGDPVIEDKGETTKDTEEIPTNWWHMLLDRVVPRNRLGIALSIRNRIKYRIITTRTEHTQIIYNICPHMNTDSEVHHSQWLESDPKQSMDMASLLHILRNASDGRELDTLRKIWYSQKLGENYGKFEVVSQTIADLIEMTLRKKDKNETDATIEHMEQAPQIASVLKDIVYMSGVSTPEGEAHSLPILRESLWEGYQILIKAGIIEAEDEEDD